jgi:hypothetical protein
MPGPISRHAAIRIRKDVVFRELEGEMVLLNLATGVYFGLDAVGTRIWALIEAHRSSDEIVETLTAEYEVDAATLGEDLARFVQTLRDNELVDVDDGSAR